MPHAAALPQNAIIFLEWSGDHPWIWIWSDVINLTCKKCFIIKQPFITPPFCRRNGKWCFCIFRFGGYHWVLNALGKNRTAMLAEGSRWLISGIAGWEGVPAFWSSSQKLFFNCENFNWIYFLSQIYNSITVIIQPFVHCLYFSFITIPWNVIYLCMTQ